MTNDIIKYPDVKNDVVWTSIIEQLYETLSAIDGMPDKVISAAEMMVANWPIYKIAKELDVSTKTVRGWLTQYPQLAMAVADARQDMGKWRMEQLEQQFLLALKKSEEILTTSVVNAQSSEEDTVKETVNAKLLGIQAQHSRYLIDLFVGNKFDLNINIREDTPVLKATQSALDYIITKLKQSEPDDEPIEGIVRVIDPHEKEGPVLEPDGKPRYGEFGKIDVNEEGMLCHICGKRYARLDIHIRTREGYSNESYETLFMLAPGAIKDIIGKTDGQKTTGSSST